MNIKQIIAIKGKKLFRVLLILFLGLSISLSLNPDQIISANEVLTDHFGGNGGVFFRMIPIRSIGLRTSGSNVNSVTINNQKFGNWKNNNSGKDQQTLDFEGDEYISKVDLCYGDEVYAVYFHTSKGRSIGGGQNCAKSARWRSKKTLEGVRVLQIGGRSAKRVDKLDIMYVPNYQPSKVVDDRASFILKFVAPTAKILQYKDNLSREASTYQQVNKIVLQQKYSASVQGELYAQISSSIEFNVENLSEKTITKELENVIKSGESQEITVPNDSVGVYTFIGKLMRSANNEYFPIPTSAASLSIVKLDNLKGLSNKYDLTGELKTQLPNLISEFKNGYTYYKD
jgi:hypothetical protein